MLVRESVEGLLGQDGLLECQRIVGVDKGVRIDGELRCVWQRRRYKTNTRRTRDEYESTGERTNQPTDKPTDKRRDESEGRRDTRVRVMSCSGVCVVTSEISCTQSSAIKSLK